MEGDPTQDATVVHVPDSIPNGNRWAMNRVAELSGENVHLCMQCGTCSAVCPMIESMGFTTRQGIHYLQFGMIDEVIDARIGDYCASCHTCEVRCPRGIEVPKVFEAVRLLSLRANKDLVILNEIPRETLEEAPQIAMVSTFRKLTA